MPATMVTTSEYCPDNFWKHTSILDKLVEWTLLHTKNRKKIYFTPPTVKSAATEKCIRRSQQQPVDTCQPIRIQKLAIWDSEFLQQDGSVEPKPTAYSMVNTKADTELSFKKYSSLDELSTSYQLNSLPLAGETPYIYHLRHTFNVHNSKPDVMKVESFKAGWIV
ncbi:hypothetical protein BDF14DRAFT_1882098 [Spinellus fusiger]|nr:hypothetical protein BDF14DRAFT_1882098 [Spinellus fusiger]